MCFSGGSRRAREKIKNHWSLVLEGLEPDMLENKSVLGGVQGGTSGGAIESIEKPTVFEGLESNRLKNNVF